jgi:hypothetical protein
MGKLNRKQFRQAGTAQAFIDHLPLAEDFQNSRGKWRAMTDASEYNAGHR